MIIGDSYAEGYTPDGNVTSWAKLLQAELFNKYNNVYINALGGTGFIYNSSVQSSFLSLLKNFDIADNENVTDIIVCGGYNDTGVGPDEVLNRIGEFCNYAKTKYIKASFNETTRKNVNVLVGYNDDTFEYANVQLVIFGTKIGIVNNQLSDDKRDFKDLKNVKNINFLGASFYFPQQYV